MWSWKNLIVYSIIAIMIFIAIYYFVMEFVAIFSTITFIAIGLLSLKIADDLLLQKVDTFNEIIKRKNIAYAYYILAIAVIVGCGLLASTFVFWRM